MTTYRIAPSILSADFARLGQGPVGQKFQQHRQMIGQFGPVKIETPGTVGFQQIDHRAAAPPPQEPRARLVSAARFEK